MILLCERCFGPIDPERERYYQLAHVAHADRSGRVAWNHACVHTDPCVSTTRVAEVADTPEQRRAA